MLGPQSAPNAATDAAQKRRTRCAYRKLVLNQSSEDPCNAVDSGAPEGPVWKRERCRWLPKVSYGPTPEQFFDYNLLEGAVIMVFECLVSIFSGPRGAWMGVSPSALDRSEQDVAAPVLKTDIKRTVFARRPF